MFNTVRKVLCLFCCLRVCSVVVSYPTRKPEQNIRDSDYKSYRYGRFPFPQNQIQSFPSSKRSQEDPYSLKKSSSNQIPNSLDNNFLVNDIKKENKEFDGVLWEQQSYKAPQISMKENIVENVNISQDNVSLIQSKDNAGGSLLDPSSSNKNAYKSNEDSSPLLNAEEKFSNRSFTLPKDSYPNFTTTEKNPDPVVSRYNARHFAAKKRNSVVDRNSFGYPDYFKSRQNFRRDQKSKRKASNGFLSRNFIAPLYSNFDYGDEIDDPLFNGIGDINPNYDPVPRSVSGVSKDEYDKNKFLNPFSSPLTKVKLARMYRNEGYLLPDRKSFSFNPSMSQGNFPFAGYPVRTRQVQNDISLRSDGNFKTKPFYNDNTLGYMNRKSGLKAGMPNSSTQKDINGNLKTKSYADNSFGYLNGVDKKPGFKPNYYKDSNYPQNTPLDYDIPSKHLDLFPPENGFDPKFDFPNSYNNQFFGNNANNAEKNMKSYGGPGNSMQNAKFQNEKQASKTKPGFNGNSFPQNMPIDYDLSSKTLGSDPVYTSLYNNPFFGNKISNNERSSKRSDAPSKRQENTNVQKEVYEVKKTEVNDPASNVPIDTVMMKGTASDYSKVSLVPKTNFSGLIQELSGSIENLINDTKNMLDSSGKDKKGPINCQNDLCAVGSPNNETKVIKNESISFLIRTSKSSEGNSSEFSLTQIETAPESITTSSNKGENKTVEEPKETLKFKFDIKTENTKPEEVEDLNHYGFWPRLPLPDYRDQAGPSNGYSPLMYDKPVSNVFKIPPENTDYGDYGMYHIDEKPRHSIVKKHLGNSQFDSPENYQNYVYRDIRPDPSKESSDFMQLKKLLKKDSRMSKNKSAAIDKKMSSHGDDIKTKITFTNMERSPPDKKVDVPENVNKIVYEKIEYIGKSKMNEEEDKVLKSPSLVKKTTNYEMNSNDDLSKESNIDPNLEAPFSPPMDREFDTDQRSVKEDVKSDAAGSEYSGYYGSKSPEFESNGMDEKSSNYLDDAQKYPKEESTYDGDELKKEEKMNSVTDDGAAYEDDPYYNEAEKNVENEVRNSLWSERSHGPTDSKKINSDYDENSRAVDGSVKERSADMYESPESEIEGESNRLDDTSLSDSDTGNILDNEDQLEDYPVSKVPLNVGVRSKPGSDYKRDKLFGASKNNPISENQNSPLESPVKERFEKVEKNKKITNKVIKNRKNMHNQTDDSKNERNSDKEMLKEPYLQEQEEQKFTDDNDESNNSKNQPGFPMKFHKKTGDNNFKQTEIAPDPDVSQSLDPSRDEQKFTDDNDESNYSKNQPGFPIKLHQKPGDKNFKQTGISPDPDVSQSLDPSRDPATESKFISPKGSYPKGYLKSKGGKNRQQDYEYEDEDIEYDDDDEEYDNEEEDYGTITKFDKAKIEKDRKLKAKMVSKIKEQKVSQPYTKNSENEPSPKGEGLMKRSQTSNKIKIDIQNKKNEDENDKAIRSFDQYPKSEEEEYDKNPNPEEKESDIEPERVKESKTVPRLNVYKSPLNETEQSLPPADKFNQNPSYGFQGNSDVEKEDYKEVPNFKKPSSQDDRFSPSRQRQFQGNKRKGYRPNKRPMTESPEENKGQEIIASRKAMLKKAEYKLSVAEKQMIDDNGKMSAKSDIKLTDPNVNKIPQKTESPEETESFGKNVNGEDDYDATGIKSYPKSFQNNYKQESRSAPSKKLSSTQKILREDSPLQKNHAEKIRDASSLSSPQNGGSIEDAEDREVLELGLQLLKREKELDEIENQDAMRQNIKRNELNPNAYVDQTGNQIPIVAPFRNIPRYKKSSSKLEELLGKEISNLQNSDKLKGFNGNRKAASKEIKYEKKIKGDKANLDAGEDGNKDAGDVLDENAFNTTNSWLIMNEEDTIDDDKEKTKMKESKIFKEIHKLKATLNKPNSISPSPSEEGDKVGPKTFPIKIEPVENEDASSDNQKKLGRQKTSLKRRAGGSFKKPDARKRHLFRKIKRSDNSMNPFETSLSDSVMEPILKFSEKRPVTESNVLDAESGNIYYMTIGTTTQDEKIDDFVHFKE